MLTVTTNPKMTTADDCGNPGVRYRFKIAYFPTARKFALG
jgi:hypothetical protein